MPGTAAIILSNTNSYTETQTILCVCLFNADKKKKKMCTCDCNVTCLIIRSAVQILVRNLGFYLEQEGKPLAGCEQKSAMDQLALERIKLGIRCTVVCWDKDTI